MDRITLTAMRYEARLGASDEERSFPQLVEVDIEVEADLSAAASSDRLADTIDYGPLVELTARTAERGSYKLLEGLAGAILEGVQAVAPAAHAVTVRVRKLAVPMDVDMDHAQVELVRVREVRS